MITHDLIQGSNDWHVFRAGHFGASEAAAMLGISPYETRSEMLKRKATGITPEISPQLQAIFDRGHQTEIGGLVMAEEIIGESLYPATISDGKLSASCDGVTLDYSIAFEHKQYNAALAESVRTGHLPPEFEPQCQQVIMLTGAKKLLFMTSDGTKENCVWMWIEPSKEWCKKLMQGWKQFAEDVANYQHVEAKPVPVAEAIESLPALLVQVDGRVLATNLDIFKDAAQSFIANIKTELVSDQDFVDADKMVKFLKEGEDQLASVKSHALAQTASIDELFKTIDYISEQMRSKRLALDKLVEAEKQNRRAEIIRDAQDAYMAHIDKLNARIGNYMPRSVPAFAESIKGLKSLDSMHEKIGNAVRDSMFHASEIADRIEQNIKYMKALFDNTDYSFLFPDIAQIVLKASDDFAGVVTMRVNEHKEAEYKRLEAETERIRQEEADRITRESAQAATDQRATEITASLQSQLSENGVTVEQSDMKSMLDAFLEKMVQPDRRNNIRSIIMAWEQFKAER